jgi:hypothetical protein
MFYFQALFWLDNFFKEINIFYLIVDNLAKDLAEKNNLAYIVSFRTS